jgi:hypothetical protein
MHAVAGEDEVHEACISGALGVAGVFEGEERMGGQGFGGRLAVDEL